MLSGQITYYFNNRAFKYDVVAVDTSEVFSMYMTSGNYDAIMLMSNADIEEDADALWERSAEVKLTKVNVQTKVFNKVIDGKSKKVKAPVNADLFCRLGALIRYAKVNCNTYNEEGYTGLQLASGEFKVSAEKNYIIKFPMNEEQTLAKVTLKYGDISNLYIQSDDFLINLKTENAEASRVFYKPKDAWSSGFRLDEEYLGFKLKPQVIPTIKSSDGMYHSIEEIIEAHPDKEFSWLLKKDYHIVTDDTLEEVCNYIVNWDGYVYYDTETTGLNINFLSRTGQADQAVGVVLSVKYGESFYFPLQMKSIKNLCGGDHFYVMEHYLKPILEGKDLVAHNMSFDWKVGYIYGINCNIVHDTMAILHLTLGEEIKDFKVGLKDNAKLLLGRDSLELSDLLIDDSWGESDIKFWDLPEELVRLYACADTDNTNGLLGYAMQNDLLGKYGAHKVYEIEIAFSYAVAYQEFYGHRIDINNLDSMREEIGKLQDEEMAKMVEIVGHEFNPNSPKQLVNIIYGELGIPEQISRKTGRPTTDKETLKKLAELTDAEDNVMYPFIVHLQKYREAEGVRKIIDKFPEHVTGDGYVFSHVMQYGTTTGRVSINTPNYQSYNDPIKKNVIPRPGFWMFDTDYSSVEYRVLGNMVGNKKIMESFKDPDFDYHSYQAARMYGVPYSAVNKKMRKAAKGINFGLPYGMGDESLGIRVFGEESPENTRKAAALRAAYFKGQEDIRDWFEFHRDKGVNEGYTETFFGRRRYYRKSDFSESAIRRQAGNQVIQGCVQGDTLIHEKVAGLVKIKDLVGLNTEVWNGTTWTRGDILYSGKKRKCIVKFTNGQEFVCSPIHRFKVVPNTVKCFKDINPNWVEDIEKDGVVGGYFVRCKDLKKGYAICVNEGSDLVINDYDNRFHDVTCYDSSQKHAYQDKLPCIVVESVEITDEYIDMYDVCNTDCGYYVADGIVTHNTAADIYKTAVGRVFKRICKEGWLGKVIFTGFIHDELLGEVSNEINPGVFLKALREEFEVKINNDDGTSWSPLYMGFGYGMSWYEAKSVELPIKLQWEIVDKYGVDGFPEWDGDGRKFCDSIPDKLRDFEVRDIRNQILDPDSQDKEIKPTLNNQILDMCKEDSKIYPEAMSEYLQEDYNEINVYGIQTYLSNCEDVICKWLDSHYYIQGLLKNEDGTFVEDFEFKPATSTQDAITQYCMLHGVDRSKVNLKDIEEYKGGSNINDSSCVLSDYEDDSDLTSEEKLQHIKDTRIDTLGLYLDTDKMEITLMALPNQFMNFIQQRVNREEKGYRVFIKDTLGLYDVNKKGALYSTKSWLASEDIQLIQQLYLRYFKTRQ